MALDMRVQCVVCRYRYPVSQMRVASNPNATGAMYRCANVKRCDGNVELRRLDLSEVRR